MALDFRGLKVRGFFKGHIF